MYIIYSTVSILYLKVFSKRKKKLDNLTEYYFWQSLLVFGVKNKQKYPHTIVLFSLDSWNFLAEKERRELKTLEC